MNSSPITLPIPRPLIQSRASSLRSFAPYVTLFAIWFILFTIGVTGYPNLMDNERRIGAYALDMMQNGNWIAQHDSTGEFMSKPPGITWLVVLASVCTGGLSRFSLYLPSAFATLAVTFLIFQAGCRYFTDRAAFTAALVYLLSYVSEKQLTTARYDGLFTLPVFLGMLALYRGWKEGQGWRVFWLAMTFGTMIKGPLVFVLPMLALFAVVLEKHTGHLFRWHWHHVLGLTVFAVVCGGWLALVLHYHGKEFIDKILHRELVGHAWDDGGNYSVGERFYVAPLDVLLQFLPWSPIAIFAAVRLLRRGEPGDGHSFERYLSCYFVAGLILFSLAAHQRGRLTWPLIPALALLTGRQLDIWMRNISSLRLRRWAAALASAVILASAFYHYRFIRHSRKCQETLALRDVAALLRKELGDNPPVTYVDAPFAVQFYLQQFHVNARVSAAAQMLGNASPVFIIASGNAAEKISEAAPVRPFTLHSWPSENRPGQRAPGIKVLSNHSSFHPNHPRLSAQMSEKS